MSRSLHFTFAGIAAAAAAGLGAMALLMPDLAVGANGLYREAFLAGSAVALLLAVSLAGAPARSESQLSEMALGGALLACGIAGGLSLLVGATHGHPALVWIGCTLLACGALLIQTPRFVR